MTNLTQLESIQKFIKDSKQIAPVINDNILRYSGEDSKVLFQIDLDTDEIHRSIINTDGSALFIIDIDFHEYPLLEGLTKALSVAKQIEEDFPNEFLPIFSGRGMKLVAKITQTKENIMYISRFSSIFVFYKSILKYLEQKFKIELDKTFVSFMGLTRSIGSYNNHSGMYSIPIDYSWGVLQILENSRRKNIIDFKIPELDVKKYRYLLSVHQPYGDKIDWYGVNNKYPIAFEKYPPCVLAMFAEQSKGNKERFDILRYLFTIHSVPDSKTILRQVLTQEEYGHLTREGQDKYVFSVKYPPPSCQYMQAKGFCTKECGRSNPTILETKEEKKDENIKKTDENNR